MVKHRCAQCGQVYDRDEQSDAYVTVDDEDGQAEYVLHRECARAIFDE